MKLVIQRVIKASVSVENKQVSSIGHGLLILLGIHEDDSTEDVVAAAQKISRMRIMSDSEGKMNRSVKDVNGSVLVVSQFTLISDTRKGNRPSFIKAALPDKAKKLYETFVQELKNQEVKRVETGAFGAYMQVELVNDGPVTIVI
jgi:D-tyrosyl-tRNA(Tyr) deacylase